MSENLIEIAVQGADGGEVGKIALNLDRFDDRRRRRLLKEAVVMYQANKRVGTHATKNRAKIAGSNRKPWRQKGTGRARAGTRKSPLWRGGGVIFGPSPRDHGFRINKKQRKAALRSALFSKLKDGEIRVVDTIELAAPKTREVARLLDALQIVGGCLVGTETLNHDLYLASRNIPGVRCIPVAEFNALDVLSAETILLTRRALEILEADAAEGKSEAVPTEAVPTEAVPTEAVPTEAVPKTETAAPEGGKS